MFSTSNFRLVVLYLAVLFISNWIMGREFPQEIWWVQAAQAASDQAPMQLPVSKTISQKGLEKYIEAW
jgi:hypothetical protein